MPIGAIANNESGASVRAKLNLALAQLDAMSGVIMLWSGTVASIPTGWFLCNGSNGTPDLRDRFVVGARQDDAGVAKTNLTGALTQSGGSISHTHNITDPTHAHSWAETTVATGAESVVSYNAGATDAAPTGVTADSTDAPQPYYALAYIMKS